MVSPMLRPSIEHAARALRRRANSAAFAGELSRQATVAFFALGSLALALRLLAAVPAAAAALPLLALAVLPLVSFLRARRRFLSESAALAWLDVRSGGTGLVVARAESGDVRWDGAAREAAARPAPAPRVLWRRLAAPPAGALAFALAALLVPIPRPAAAAPAVAASRIEEIAFRLAILEETVDLDAEVAKELRERLEWLEKASADARPEGAFEAADRLLERLGAEAEAAADAAERAEEKVAAAGEAGAGSEIASDAIESALETMADAGLASDPPPALTDALGGASLELPPGTTLSGERLAAIKGELQAMLASKWGALAKAGLLSSATKRRLAERRDGRLAKAHVCDASCERKPGGS